MENNDIEQWFSTYEGYRKSEIEIIRNRKNWKESYKEQIAKRVQLYKTVVLNLNKSRHKNLYVTEFIIVSSYKIIFFCPVYFSALIIVYSIIYIWKIFFDTLNVQIQVFERHVFGVKFHFERGVTWILLFS